MKNIDGDQFDVLDLLQDAIPRKSLPPPGVGERRQKDRYSVNWRVVVNEGLKSYGGRLKDISIHGAAILSDRNFQPHVSITIQIDVPPVKLGVRKVLTIHCVTSNAVHDISNQCFRVGVAFKKFELASDQAYLDGLLKNLSSTVEILG